MNSSTDAPLAREAFERALLDAVEAWPCEETRFYRLLQTGRAPRAVLRRYARSTWLSARLFCASVAELALKAPDPMARLVLLENLLEEEGAHVRAEKGLVVRPEVSHPALALRLLRACGGDEADAEDDGVHATGEGRAMLAEGRWLEAVSNLLVGQELKFGDASGKIFDGLRRNGIADRDAAFFAVHVEADSEHGRQALDLVLDRAVTADDQRRCIAAAAAGARSWFDLHGGRADAPAMAGSRAAA